MRGQFRHAKKTATSLWKVLGIILGPATLISIVQTGLAFELSGLPAKLYRNYSWLRDLLFSPLVWLLLKLNISLSTVAKDLLTAYVLIGAAHARAMLTPNREYKVLVMGPDHPRHSRIARLIMLTVGWPLTQIVIHGPSG